MILLFLLSQTHAAGCSPDPQSIIQECSAARASAAAGASSFASGQGQQASGTNIQVGAAALRAASDQSSAQAAQAQTACQAALAKCSSIQCADQSAQSAARKSCASGVQALLTQTAGEIAQAQSASGASQNTQSAAKGSGDMSALAGMAGGLAAGAMLGQALTSDSGSTSATTAVTATNVDCTSSDGYRYSDCDATFVSSCYGTFTTATCASFSQRYCASTYSAGTSVLIGSSTYATVDATGTGVASSFCQYYVASNYCATSGRETCLSCQLLPSFSSTTCQTSPTLCLAQSSSSVVSAAQTACPTDPIFSNPSFSTYASSVSAGSANVATALRSEVGGVSTSLFSVHSAAIRNVVERREGL